jgi:hypothetical protein
MSGAPSDSLRALSQLQALLESVHGLSLCAPVGDFLIDAAARERLAPSASPDEALLVLEGGDTLRVALFLDERVLGQLAQRASAPWTLERLSAFCAAAEGVSHFLYLAHRAGAGRPVSQLELEAQAELDKYLCVILQLWAVGRRSASPELRRRLFERVALRSGLSAVERDRYRLANALAAACARVLEAKYVLAGRLEALLREVRKLYRLGGGEKLTALAQGLAVA